MKYIVTLGYERNIVETTTIAGCYRWQPADKKLAKKTGWLVRTGPWASIEDMVSSWATEILCTTFSIKELA